MGGGGGGRGGSREAVTKWGKGRMCVCVCGGEGAEEAMTKWEGVCG